MERKEYTSVPHMATLLQAAEITGLSYYCIRDWCVNGKVAYVRAGGPRGKILVNMDKLTEFLNGEGGESHE